MYPFRAALTLVLVMPWTAAASAEDICPALRKLIENPPAGFLAERGAEISPQRWAAPPIVEGAKCVVWASRSAEAHNMRCTINDGAPPAAASAFYTATTEAITRCLGATPGGGKYDRRAALVESEGLKGSETKWVLDTDTLRWQIDLTDYRRTYDGSTYNSLSVEYLKY